MSVARMPRLAIQIDTVLPKTAGVKNPSPPTIRANMPMIRAQAAMMSPKTMNPAMIFSRISTTLPKTDTTSATIGLALASGSAQAVAVAAVTSPMDCAVIFSPFISSFCRAERAAGTANHMMK